QASVTINNPPMGNYFVFVDSPSAGASGNYVLTVSGAIPDNQPCDPANRIFTCSARHVCAERVPGQGTKCVLAQCADGVDNDGDGKIDYPHDPGCTSFEDDDEGDDTCRTNP